MFSFSRSFIFFRNLIWYIPPNPIIAAAIAIFIKINFPYVESVSDATLSSKNHSNVGPVMIKIPIAIMNNPENLGIKLSVIFSFIEFSVFVMVGNATNAKNITPPIHMEDNKLCE